MKNLIAIVGIFILFVCCKSTKINNDSDLISKKDSINLYAFIGEKISVTEFNPNENNFEIVVDSVSGDTMRLVNYVMDRGFKAKYKVLKNVFNELKFDTIEFDAYDHYGRPQFENYENILLYISLDKENGNFYHQKYQFDPVKKTKNGRWKGLNDESVEVLFDNKKSTVFKARGIFN